jgi:hypothetical protein
MHKQAVKPIVREAVVEPASLTDKERVEFTELCMAKHIFDREQITTSIAMLTCLEEDIRDCFKED